jgi:hypothetical protein
MPEAVEEIYDELKEIEKDALDAFKKAYPKIPTHFWDNVETIEKQTQTWLSDTAFLHTVMQEPILKDFASETELKKYCSLFIEYECIKQGIDFKKIELQYKQFNDNTLACAQGPEILISKEHMSFFEVIQGIFQFYYSINSMKKCIITIDIEKLIKTQNYYKKQTLKHELVHLTEAHSAKTSLIKYGITSQYNPEELKTSIYLNLYNEYAKSKELMADILPSLLSHEHATQTLYNTDTFRRKSTIYPNHITIQIWLKKIHWLFFKRTITKLLSFFNIFG